MTTSLVLTSNSSVTHSQSDLLKIPKKLAKYIHKKGFPIAKRPIPAQTTKKSDSNLLPKKALLLLFIKPLENAIGKNQQSRMSNLLEEAGGTLKARFIKALNIAPAQSANVLL